MNISIILPVYNEDKNITNAIRQMHQYLSRRFNTFEIIVVDDGSKDRTVVCAEGLAKELNNIRIISYPVNHGKGYAVKSGVLSAKHDLILFLDCDMSIPIGELERFLQCIEKGYDMIIGSRKLPKSILTKPRPFIRDFLGRGFTFLSNIILLTHFSDFTCAFKLFKREIAIRIFTLQTIERWAFDSEILFIACRRGVRWRELAVTFESVRTSKVRLGRDIIKSFVELMQIRLKAFMGYY